MKFLIILNLFFLTVIAHAQSSVSDSTEINTLALETPVGVADIESATQYFTAMVAVYPLPVLTIGGSRGSSLVAELKPLRNLSVLIAGSIIIEEDDGTDFNFFDQETKIENKTVAASLRFYAHPQHRGWYTGVGYLDGETDVTYRPGLFGGLQASRAKSLHGAIGELGFRFEGGAKSYGDWMIDLGISYEPTRIYDVKYTGTLNVFTSASTSDVQFKVGYDIKPAVRAGLSF